MATGSIESGSRGNILVVEDNGGIADVACSVLESEGYSPVHADNGLVAFRYLRNPQSPKTSLILLDLFMPEMDGKMFLGERRKYNYMRKIPVVLMSAIHDLTVPSEDNIAGRIDKPFNLEDLIHIVNSNALSFPPSLVAACR